MTATTPMYHGHDNCGGHSGDNGYNSCIGHDGHDGHNSCNGYEGRNGYDGFDSHYKRPQQQERRQRP